MKKREKKAVFSKFRRTMMVSGAAAAILASSVVPAFAIEKDTNDSSQEIVQEVKQVESNVEPASKEVVMDFTKAVFSNIDTERRAALEKQYNIQLDFSDVWEDKKGQTTIGPDGVKSEYTSHDEMKSLGFYAVNANRQELIKYAVRTGKWEPYNQYERDLLAKQEAEKATKAEKVANVTNPTMKVASTTAIAAPTELVFDFTSTEVDSNEAEPLNVTTSGTNETPTNTTAPSLSPIITEEKEEVVTTDATVSKELVFDTTTTVDEKTDGLDSNNDRDRRAALEDKFGITLDSADKWEDKKGQTTIGPDGVKREYTSHDEMKSLGFYAVNANRQELIQYGIRTDDWQPYRAFSALTEPAYFEHVNGLFEYSKVYYGNDFENTRMNYAADLTAATIANDTAKKTQIEADMKKALSAIAKSYKAAPGPNVYVIGLNSNDAYAAEWGVSQVESGFFDSNLNHPDVMDKGIYKDGHNPFTKLFQ